MKKAILLFFVILGCNSYNKRMNQLLSDKKIIEIKIDSNNEKDKRFREITGYNELDDSISINKQYVHPELVDSIWQLKEEKEVLSNLLKNIKYSIDSLQKLKP